jgi:catechol 2,3-dioxygenase-like lactoylglutathione lyase family enzyme
MKTASFREVNPVLAVRNVDAAIRYYTEKLGFRVSFQDSPTDPKYAGVRRDNVELHLQWHDEKDFKYDGSDPPILRFIVDDPDSLYEEYKMKNALGPKSEVKDTPWGTREFGLFEPDGTGLVFYRDL